MRLLAASALLALLAGACAPTGHRPASPLALEQVGAGIGPDVVAARQTVLDFVRAYAEAPADGGAALSAMVAGPKLTEWVRWLAIQNGEFRGTIGASVEVRSIELVGIVPVQGGVGARLELGASVTFAFDPVGDRPFRRTRILDGPVTLIRVGRADWKVLDATRDGASMDGGIQLFDGLQQERHGVTLRLDSLFRFTPNWQFNVLVRNRTGAPIRLAGGAVLLVENDGETARRHGVVTASLERVPDGATVAGLAAFPLQPSPRGRILVLAYRTADGRRLDFAFPMARRITPSGVPPTASPAPPDASR
ncbi:MAG: hypothetical protein ACE14W_04065 [Candidatus Velamenicoccus archaeovorus]